MQPPREPMRTKKHLPQFLREPSCPWWLELSLAIVFTIALASTVACANGSSAGASALPNSESPAATPAAPIAAKASSAPPDDAPLPHIDAKRAFEYTREVTAFGTRYMGNENHKKLERYIVDHLKEDHLKPDDIEDDDVALQLFVILVAHVTSAEGSDFARVFEGALG